MNITFEELRKVKHLLPTGSVRVIAQELNMEEQAVRNYFGAHKYNDADEIVNTHYQSGPDGGIVRLEDTKVLDLANKIIRESQLAKLKLQN